MSDRLFRRSLVAAVGVHLGLLAAGGWMAPRFASPAEEAMRTIDVELQAPEPEAPRPTLVEPRPPTPPPPTESPVPTRPLAAVAVRPDPPPRSVAPTPSRPATPAPPATGMPPAPRTVAAAVPPEPGGALNLGTPSIRGDLPGLPTGQTPVGWVPGPDEGKGAGSGSAAGVGQPEPPAVPVPAPAPAPEPAPPVKPEPPPPPRRVSVRVCAVTRLRPNPHCPESVTLEFVAGTEPREGCALHQAPPPPPPPVAPPPPEPAPAPPKEEKREEPRFTPARLVHTVKPEYPPAAVAGDRVGVVVVRAMVRADGSCGDVEVAQSSGSRVLDNAALKAVRKWRWEPARRGEEPVASTVRCRIRFELEE